MAEVFYRKWRPQKLDQLIGQEPIAQTLRQAVVLDRVAHAYLFCGPRGTGKTSTARILAKAVNCLSPQDGEPDNECDICRSMNESRALDLIEIDAASNRGIDDIRNLSEKIRFTPNEARYKVYIIDEVHMLTEPAFNALLKTLEEPPGHAIFVLATTEPHKVPLTIISRCQRFDFRRIPPALMAEKLADLCVQESIETETEALRVICRAASGSLRDAENLLEQTFVSYGSPLTHDHVRDLLELGGEEAALELVAHVIRRSLRDALVAVNQVAGEGSDLRQLQRGAVEYLRAALLLKAGAGESMAHSDAIVERLRSLAEDTSTKHLVQALKAFAEVDLRQDPASPLPIELAVVEACSTSEVAAEPSPEPAPRPNAARARTAEGVRPPAAAEAPVATPATTRPYTDQPDLAAPGPVAVEPVAPGPDTPRPPAREEAVPESTGGPPSTSLDAQWDSIIKELRHTGKRFKLGALLRGCKGRAVSDGVVTLKFQHASHVARMDEELGDPGVRRDVERVIAGVMDGEYRVQVALLDASDDASRKGATLRSPLVRAAQVMGARVVDEKEEEPQ